MILSRVISGGQTGVDQAALWAARSLGIPTGGTAPRGWITLEGPRPDLGTRFGLTEHPTYGYKWRTYKNAADADATLQMAYDFYSPGERCTTKACEIANRPCIRFDLRDDYNLRHLDEFARDIYYRRIQILNVAGNSNETCPGIFKVARILLTGIFEMVLAFETEPPK